MTLAEKIRHLQVAHGKKPKEHRGLIAEPFEEMDRMLERFMGRSLMREWMRPRWWPFETALEGAGLPRVDVIDREDEVRIRAEMPGVKKEDLDVSLSENAVTLRGQIKEEHEEKEDEYYYYKETGHGEFLRTIDLPAAVDASKAKATYKEGVLDLVLPKVEAAKRQTIKIEG
jgi:HSP20 family protein